MYFGGRNNNGNFVKGWNFTLDEVAIFDEEKNGDWVTGAYDRGQPNDLQNESGLVGYWRFEETSGARVEDLSENGNHGTLTSSDRDTYGLPEFSSDTPPQLKIRKKHKIRTLQKIHQKHKIPKKLRGR